MQPRCIGMVMSKIKPVFFPADGNGPVRLRHFQLSVRLCRTALPEPGRARHSLEFPPAFWVSSPLGYED